jgi:hypothetical protein
MDLFLALVDSGLHLIACCVNRAHKVLIEVGSFNNISIPPLLDLIIEDILLFLKVVSALLNIEELLALF